MGNWTEDFKSNVIYRLDENIRMVSIALSKVDDDETWVKQNLAINTLGNQLLHIIGNLKQYVISGLGGEADNRNREEEFNAEDGPTKDELLKQLLHLGQEVTSTIQNASEEDLLKKYKVQGFDLSGMGLVIHAVEHFSYHTGQIATLVKLVVNEPLGFYAGLDLNILNQVEDDGDLEGSDLDSKNEKKEADDIAGKE
ncbi:DUF1572 domain-containing protein [Dokdonia sinensis]|uniref:DUF1572 domain-containing protein n=1 Tax=Dokdonia sinensis TaxID=2479847 RepID=A0A3M0GJ63_9FLAO|nr:DinB family protein [Dokdonia sinensis]RMB57336.1 DUF1572 domain-containing protein [Dokdonia sinensis]